MPKRGGQGRPWNRNNNNTQSYNGRSDYATDKFFAEHDDRINDNRKNEVKRRVSFKPSGRNGKGGRISDIAIRAHFEDDEDMGVGTNDTRNKEGGSRNNFRGKGGRRMRRSSPPPRSGKRKLICGTTGWYQVTIPYGQKYDKKLVLQSILQSISPSLFIPHYYKVEGNSVSFFVDDYQMADAIYNADRLITMPDGFKMIIKVRGGIPQVNVDSNLKEIMKLAMVKRYTAATKALDLTKFHSDPELLNYYCGLSRPTIMLAVFDIIAENIPDLEALNLSDNKLHLLDHFKCLPNKLPNLKILHMANNKISAASSLDALKGLPIIDLVLQGNPLRDRLKYQTSYISEIRKRLPKVMKLDFEDLPPAINFDVDDDVSLIPAKASFLCQVGGADVVRQFLEQYFIIYDSSNRQPLLDAYHEHAMFSMTATFSTQQGQRLTPYLIQSRNISRVRDMDTRSRYLKQGRLPVVSFLSELPATQHDPQSFGVDLTLFTSQLLHLTVTGVFRETGGSQPLRSFQRTLIIVPANGGFCIRNEMVHINNVTTAQERSSFKAPTQPAAVATITQQQQVATPSTSTGIDEAAQMQLVETMSQQSGMNFGWSKKCLEDTNWDFQRAAFAFTQLQKENKIPPEAFIK